MLKKEIYLSKNGHRQNEGTKENPFGLAFLDVLEQIKRDKVKGEIYDYTVYIEGGTQYIGAPIQINEQHEGSITFKALNDEPVIISGGKRIENLEETVINGHKAVKAYITSVHVGSWNFKELYVNKEPRPRPTYPANGHLRIADVPGGMQGQSTEITNTFFINDGDFDTIDYNIEDCEIVITHYWIDERMPIEKFDKEKNLVVSSKMPARPLVDDYSPRFAKYRVENVYSELKEQGQWYLDRKTGYLYYILKDGETIDNIIIEAPKAKELLNINADNVHFENIIFENAVSYVDSPKAAFGQAASLVEGAIRVSGAKNVGFEGCLFRNMGNYAVEFGDGCRSCTINNSEIKYCGAGGIKVMGSDYFEDEKSACGYMSFTNNHIHHNTLRYYSAIGIYIRNGFSMNISGNEIHDMMYSGISVGWVWGFFKSRACDNTITHNHIYNLGDGQMSDMGGIYLLGPQGGTVVSHNHIHNIKKANYGGWGIYLDEGSMGVTVEKNIVHHTASECFFSHWAKENIVRYNIFAFPIDGGVVGISSNGKYFQGMFTKNIYITDKKPIYQGEDRFDHSADYLISENNFICDVSGEKIFNSFGMTTMERYSEQAWEEWNNQRYDLFSYVGDLKVDTNTFEIAEDSIVFEYGFNNK